MKKIFQFVIVAAVIVLQSCATTTTVPTELRYTQYAVNSNEGEDSFLLKMLAPYKDSLVKTMNRVIGFSLEPVYERSAASIGNFITDAMKEQATERFGRKVDLAIMNSGGIRSYLPAGDITIGKMYELMPFDNMLVIQELPGSVLQQLFERAAGAGGWPVSGVTMNIVNRKAENIQVGGKPLELERKYVVAISDYLANGGDQCPMLRTVPQQNVGYLFRDALIEYVQKFTAAGKPLVVSKDKRISNGD
ncbi:MAG TPA: 5'-nucleotidase C-terminal domain-containing protein [Chitinophagaceae bacterium]